MARTATPGRTEALLVGGGLASAVVLSLIGERIVSTIVLLAAVLGGISMLVLKQMIERGHR